MDWQSVHSKVMNMSYLVCFKDPLTSKITIIIFIITELSSMKKYFQIIFMMLLLIVKYICY